MMKDLFLVDSKLLLDFWVEAINTANYLCNHLFRKSQVRKIISEKCWIDEKQDIRYIKVFSSIINMPIPKKGVKV